MSSIKTSLQLGQMPKIPKLKNIPISLMKMQIFPIEYIDELLM
jgi:hypothetical protein